MQRVRVLKQGLISNQSLHSHTLTPHSTPWQPCHRLPSSPPPPQSHPPPTTGTQPWRPWGLAPAGRKVQGGFSMQWADGQVSFVSVRGAGHLLPLYRPAASFTMMAAYQKGEPLPPAFYP